MTVLGLQLATAFNAIGLELHRPGRANLQEALDHVEAALNGCTKKEPIDDR